ncbi:MAG: DUF4282 domain-containing protein [Sedimentisphaerales bacterium]|nr:DUF4282 domain-containing protein [Sedimentisphaerales bacterium]
MNDFLSFRKMITPVIIQIIFWFGILGCIIAGLGYMKDSAIMGLAVIIFGSLMVRVYCELLIIAFKILETLLRIDQNTGGGQIPTAGGFPPQAPTPTTPFQ